MGKGVFLWLHLRAVPELRQRVQVFMMEQGVARGVGFAPEPDYSGGGGGERGTLNPNH